MENNPHGHSTAESLNRLAKARGIEGAVIEWRDAENAYFVRGIRMGQSAGIVLDWINANASK